MPTTPTPPSHFRIISQVSCANCKHNKLNYHCSACKASFSCNLHGFLFEDLSCENYICDDYENNP